MNLNNGMIWPYAIGISIMLVFGFGITTIVVANTAPVQESDTYMMYYQKADANANKLIKDRIAFDKKYKIEYITDGLSIDNTAIKYRVTDSDSNPISNAKIKIIITRPDNHQYDKELLNPEIKNGIYSFSNIKLEKEGRWNIIAKVSVSDLQRYYSVKADTREKKFLVY